MGFTKCSVLVRVPIVTITFYTHPMSRGQIARWALHEVGADYEERLIEYGPEMKAAQYLAVNPMGKVPAIVHDGRVVTEAAAICLYLTDAFPEAGLAPRDLDERADMLRWSFFAADPVEQAVVNRSLGWDGGGDTRIESRLGFGSFEQVVAVLSELFAGRAYVCGGRFTAADIYLGAQVDWGLQFGTLTSSPSLAAYAERLRARPAHRAAKEIDNAHIARRQAQG